MLHRPIVKTETWSDERATALFARQLAEQVASCDGFISLRGDLGAGKTTLVRHLLRACGVHGRIKSPTYALLESYDLKGWPIWHFDFYRFEDPNEWHEAGMRDIFAGPGLKLAEWPEKVGNLLPEPDLEITLFAQADDSRLARLVGHTEQGQSWLAAVSSGASL